MLSAGWTLKKKNNVTDNLEDLKNIAKKIIAGETDKISESVQGEFAELLHTILGLKHKIDEVSPAVLSTHQDLPEVSSTLENINSATEKAAFSLLDAAQNIGNFYNKFGAEIDDLEKAIDNRDLKAFQEKKDTMQKDVENVNELGFHVLEALEFQDITEQQLRKVISSIEEVGARLSSMIGSMNVENKEAILEDLGFV